MWIINMDNTALKTKSFSVPFYITVIIDKVGSTHFKPHNISFTDQQLRKAPTHPFSIWHCKIKRKCKGTTFH